MFGRSLLHSPSQAAVAEHQVDSIVETGVDLSIERIQQIGKITKGLTYCGILFTTALSVYTLRLQTIIKSDNPLEPNRFTPAGRKYLTLLLASTLFTISVSSLQNWSDSRINQYHDDLLRQGLAEELKNQTGNLLGVFNQQLQQETNSLASRFQDVAQGLDATTNKLSEARNEIDRSGEHLTRLISRTNRDLVLGGMKVRNFLVEVEVRKAAVPSHGAIVTSAVPAKQLGNATIIKNDRAHRTQSFAIKTPEELLAELQQMQREQQAAPKTSKPNSKSKGESNAAASKLAELTPMSPTGLGNGQCHQITAVPGRADADDVCALLNYIDPGHHFDISFGVTLRFFTADLVTHLDVELGQGRSMVSFLNETHTIPFQTTTAWAVEGSSSRAGLDPSIVRQLPPQEALSFRFEWDPDTPLLKSRDHWGRDTDLSSFQVNVCDENHENAKLLESHLSKFPVIKTWNITITPFDEDNHTFQKDYVVTLSSGSKYWSYGSDKCLTWNYVPN